MREWQGDIWSCLPEYDVVIPTNLLGVMGAGLAEQANKRYPGLQEQYRSWCLSKGGINSRVDTLFVWSIGDCELILAPTKRHWRNPSPLELVELCYWALSQWPEGRSIAVPPLGAGLGGLGIPKSKEIAQKYLNSDRFLFITPSPEVYQQYGAR